MDLLYSTVIITALILAALCLGLDLLGLRAAEELGVGCLGVAIFVAALWAITRLGLFVFVKLDTWGFS